MGIELDNVSRYYGSQVALLRVKVSLPIGSCNGVVGNNGAGKSTLLRILAGLSRPDSGQVRIGDLSLYSSFGRVHRSLLREIGYLEEKTLLYSSLTLEENLRLSAALYYIADVTSAMSRVVREFELSQLMKKRICEMSAGMRRRAALARALMHRPRFLFLDEPSNGLDASGKQMLISAVRNATKDNATILIASHDSSILSECCTRELVLERGSLL